MLGLIRLVCAFVVVSGAAFAADLPPRPAPAPYIPAVVPVYNWTGFYIGGNADPPGQRRYPSVVRRKLQRTNRSGNCIAGIMVV